MNNVVYNPDKRQILHVEMFKGETQILSVDANYWTLREGVTLASADWTVLEGSATVATDTETANVSSAKVTTASTGLTLIEILLTASSGGQKGIQYILVNVPVVDTPAIRY